MKLPGKKYYGVGSAVLGWVIWYSYFVLYKHECIHITFRSAECPTALTTDAPFALDDSQQSCCIQHEGQAVCTKPKLGRGVSITNRADEPNDSMATSGLLCAMLSAMVIALHIKTFPLRGLLFLTILVASVCAIMRISNCVHSR